MITAKLNHANELSQQIEKFKAAKSNNFQIKIENWTDGGIADADLRPDTQSAIKNLLISELEYLQDEFKGM